MTFTLTLVFPVVTWPGKHGSHPNRPLVIFLGNSPSVRQSVHRALETVSRQPASVLSSVNTVSLVGGLCAFHYPEPRHGRVPRR